MQLFALKIHVTKPNFMENSGIRGIYMALTKSAKAKVVFSGGSDPML